MFGHGNCGFVTPTHNFKLVPKVDITATGNATAMNPQF